MIELREVLTPAGEVRIATRGEKLMGLAFLDGWPMVERHLARWFSDDEVRLLHGPNEVARHLDAYMAGDLDALAGIPLEIGGTRFQRRIWRAIQAVPAGETETYAELALVAEAPNAVRAAGSACGANPASLVIPCHRIIRADGDLGNYGGGIERKQWLLGHERRHAR